MKTTKPKATLLGLPLDILRIILEEFDLSKFQDRQALVAFRGTSQACLSEADRLLFRNVTLHGRKSGKRTQWLLGRLTDPSDPAAGYVRHLWICHWYFSRRYTEDMWEVDVGSKLVSVLENVKGLQVLSWSLNLLISTQLLQTFHTTTPNAKLNVTHHRRGYDRLDKPLLASPQLQSLDTTVYYVSNRAGAYLQCKGHSELQILRSCLRNSSVKHLRICLEDASSQCLADEAFAVNRVTMNWKYRPLNFQLSTLHHVNKYGQEEKEAGEARFPALETLVWRGDSSFNFSTEECATWARCADWSKLTSLDMDQWTEWEFFFRHLTGRVPQLRRLSFTIYRHVDHFAEEFLSKMQSQYMPVSVAFIKAIRHLETLTFRSNIPYIFSKVLELLLLYQGYALEELEMGRFFGAEPWGEEVYIEVFEKAPNLRFLRDVVEEETDEEYDFGLKRRLYVPFEGEWAATDELAPREKLKTMGVKKKEWVKRGGVVEGIDHFMSPL